jgi:hypothetical protein
MKEPVRTKFPVTVHGGANVRPDTRPEPCPPETGSNGPSTGVWLMIAVSLVFLVGVVVGAFLL